MIDALTIPAGGMVLRDYQVEARNAVLAEWNAGRLSTLLAASTGLGKSETFLACLAAELEAGRLTRALILAHTRELVHQPRNRILRNWPQLGPVGVVMADEDETDARIICATWQTLCRRERFDRVVASGPFSHLVQDEAHHAISAGQTQIRDWCRELNPGLRVLGATATPERADGTALRSAFGSVAYVRDIIDSIEAGNLAKPIVLAVDIPTDISGVAVVNGDYESGALGQALAVENVEQIIYSTWQRWCANRKTIAFCASVAQAKALADYFSARGIAADEVDGETPKRERDAILARFQEMEPGRPQIQVLTNCAVLTEGVDLPITSALLMARPTRSTSLYVQMFGRGLRTFPGKSDCIVIDLNPVGGRDLTLAGDLLAGEERKHRARTATRPDESVSPDFVRELQAVDPERVHLAIVELERAKLLYWEFRQGLGIATVNAESTLVLAVPNADRVGVLIEANAPADAIRYFSSYRLWLSTKRQPPKYLDADEDWDKLSKRADRWARRRIDKRLAGKARLWRLGPPSDKARDAAIRCGVWQDGMTANDVSIALSFQFAGGAIRTAERRMFADAGRGRFSWPTPTQIEPAQPVPVQPVQRVMLFGEEFEV